MIDAEQQLVGIAIREPSVIDDASDITAAHFETKSLALLWSVLTSLRDAGLCSSDASMIVREAKRQSVYEAIGGAAIIGKLVANSGIASSVPLHVLDIKADYERRRLRTVLQSALQDLESSGSDASLIRSRIDSELHADTVDATGAESLDDIIAKMIDTMGQEGATSPGVKTGLPSFDDASGGLHAGELVIVAARPSVGKSALAAGIGLHAASQGSRVLFISLEMIGRDIAARMLAGESGVSFSDIRRGVAKPDQLRQAAYSFSGLPFRIWSGRNLTVDRLRAVCRLEQIRGGVDLVIVDYIGLIAPSDKRKPRWEAVTEISNSLKSLALQLEVPVIALCQLNRDAEGERPKLSHLRESGAIEQDADIVALLHRDRDSTEATLNIAKIRNGRTGVIELEFDGPATRFSEPELQAVEWEPGESRR